MIKGSIVALITPFDEEGRVNYSRLRELIDFHIEKGTDGILVLGTTGETPALTEEEQEEIKVVRAKKFQLEPMGDEEAIMQMEMLNHDFFVYLNMETDSVNVVYKRKDGNYGILETTY